MTSSLSSEHFPGSASLSRAALEEKLQAILINDLEHDAFALMARYQRILSDNDQRAAWPEIHDKLETLFMCGQAVALDGPMIGIPVSIRDSDYLKDVTQALGRERSLVAQLEWMATAWNMTFADTGLWMGKTFEAVSQEETARACENDDVVMGQYDSSTTRIGRNYFREPEDPDLIQGLGLPVLTRLWKLKPRPFHIDAPGFKATLSEKHLDKEKVIPYSMTGGIFLADRSTSAVPEMAGKEVYQLNYRWTALGPVYPMTRLIDEIVQIDQGLYLGQLVFATQHYSLGHIDIPFREGEALELGETYRPRRESFMSMLRRLFSGRPVHEEVDYGYQNNGFFLMMDPDYVDRIYADDVFPQLRPRPGEQGYQEYTSALHSDEVEQRRVIGLDR